MRGSPQYQYEEGIPDFVVGSQRQRAEAGRSAKGSRGTVWGEKSDLEWNAHARHWLKYLMPADRSPIRDAALDGNGPCAYAVSLPLSDTDFEAVAEKARRVGFDSLLALTASASDPHVAERDHCAINAFARAAHNQGLLATTTISLDRIMSNHALVEHSPRGSFGKPPPAPVSVADPRRPTEYLTAAVRLRHPECAIVRAWWNAELGRLRDLGLDGFAQIDADDAGIDLAHALGSDGHRIDNFSTLPAGKMPTDPHLIILGAGTAGDGIRVDIARAAIVADGWAMAGPSGLLDDPAVGNLNRIVRTRRHAAPARRWNGPGAKLEIISRQVADGAAVVVRNSGAAAAPWPPKSMPPLPWQQLSPAPGFSVHGDSLAPGETILFEARTLPAIELSAGKRPLPDASAASDHSLRIFICGISPSCDAGRFAVKTVLGAPVEVTADIIADGHEQLAAEIMIRAADDSAWTPSPMRAEPNDAWRGLVSFRRLGRYELRVDAWLDVWGGFARDFAKKHAAAQDLTLERHEARALIAAARDRASPPAALVLTDTLAALDSADLEDANSIVLTAQLADAMKDADERKFLTHSFIQPIEVEREAACFSSWYELFPRSQGQSRTRHGTFADVITRLPHIARMGFDTLYFPPIHPIGRQNRKGPNNALNAGPDDWGSPYAIGSVEGGHDTLHPRLGTLADFRNLVAAAHEFGIDIALDFAIQCAPDHPWLSEHPGWFAWRPDGSIKFAENPPKKYQDIVNVDFYADEAIPELWNALRDIVLFWIAQGVRAFRVDNPHTKPLPFWQWMIADVKARHPDAIFLAEAFTRPKPMYHLAKLGFSQSYTYFTWRNTKAELTDYLTELTQTEVANYFRPHFFVNTPDINPFFLQTAGRAGFLIRAALATTLSGLWGMYAGFELCEAAPLPGREEYLDSEKYELRPRPDRSPGDIVDEITLLNRIRRAEPALQTHLGLTFHNAYNDNILYYSKAVPGYEDRLLVAVNLDPFAAQEADFEVPLWLFGLADGDGVEVEDVLEDRHFRWSGKLQRMRLTPNRPYAIWRIQPGGAAHV
jgi:starch synthase (maltosyl-transferring)